MTPVDWKGAFFLMVVIWLVTTGILCFEAASMEGDLAVARRDVALVKASLAECRTARKAQAVELAGGVVGPACRWTCWELGSVMSCPEVTE